MTSTYYCPRCVDALGMRPPPVTDPLATTYQQDKREKHTSVSTRWALQIVFDSQSSRYYADCLNEALRRGFVEIDVLGRKNVIFCPSTGSQIGSKYKWGQLADRADTIVVVKTSASSEVHPMVEGFAKYRTAACSRCGKPAYL